jgi:hypothetical protein
MDGVIAFGAAYPTTFVSLVPQRSNFRQHVDYYHELCRTGTPHEAWQSPNLEAVTSTLRTLFGIAINSLVYNAVLDDTDSERKARVDHVLRQIRTDLADQDFWSTFSVMQPALLGTPAESIVFESVLKAYNIVQVQCVQLAQVILEAPSSVQGFNSVEAMTISKALLSSWRPQRYLMTGQMGFYDHYFYHQLVLGAIALPKEEVFDRPFLRCVNDQVGLWVTSELEPDFSQTVESLQHWWGVRDDDALRVVLNNMYDEIY